MQDEGTGECKTEEGVIDTYNIVGVWKQEPDETNQAEMDSYEEGNFNLLYVVYLNSAVVIGTPTAGSTLRPEASLICERYASGSFTDYQSDSVILKFGTWYTGRSNGVKFLNTSLTDNFSKSTIRNQIETGSEIQYAFTGSCGKTKLHLNRRLMDTSRQPRAVSYTLFGLNPTAESCKGQPVSGQ